MADDDDLDPAAAQMIAKVRRMMLVSGLITMVGIAAVLAVVGYRVFSTGASAPKGDATAMLPKGAKVVATALDGDRIMVTVEANGATELHLFDAQTLAPRGRLLLRPQP